MIVWGSLPASRAATVSTQYEHAVFILLYSEAEMDELAETARLDAAFGDWGVDAQPAAPDMSDFRFGVAICAMKDAVTFPKHAS